MAATSAVIRTLAGVVSRTLVLGFFPRLSAGVPFDNVYFISVLLPLPLLSYWIASRNGTGRGRAVLPNVVVEGGIFAHIEWLDATNAVQVVGRSSAGYLRGGAPKVGTIRKRVQIWFQQERHSFYVSASRFVAAQVDAGRYPPSGRASPPLAPAHAFKCSEIV